jgi:chromosome segregation ATPase
MNDSQTILSRIGNLFRRNHRDSDLPLMHDDRNNGALVPRVTFLRPWAKRDAAINNLQEGFHTLTDLLSGIRENMDRQSQRQDELLAYLSHLPEAMRAIPESSRSNGEMLRAIHVQLEQQHLQQDKLAEILEKMHEADGEQKQAIHDVRENIDAIHQSGESINTGLNGLGAALQNVSRNSTTGAQVLEQMRDRIDARDGELERILNRQNTRFTTLLAIAIFLSMSALTAVCVIGYLLLVH